MGVAKIILGLSAIALLASCSKFNGAWQSLGLSTAVDKQNCSAKTIRANSGALQFCDGKYWIDIAEGAPSSTCSPSLAGQTVVEESTVAYCDGKNLWPFQGSLVADSSCSTSGAISWSESNIPRVCFSGQLYYVANPVSETLGITLTSGLKRAPSSNEIASLSDALAATNNSSGPLTYAQVNNPATGSTTQSALGSLAATFTNYASLQFATDSAWTYTPGLGWTVQALACTEGYHSINGACRINPSVLAPASSIVGGIYGADDTDVSGCFLDSNNPTQALQIQVTTPTSDGGSITTFALADGMDPGFSLTLPSVAEGYDGHCFEIAYAQPLNGMPKQAGTVQVAVLTAVPSGVLPQVSFFDPNAVWSSSLTSTAGLSGSFLTDNFKRSQQTFFYQTATYRVGISELYGAAISEFYNLRVLPSGQYVNLITPNPGAMFQTAFMGADPGQNSLVATEIGVMCDGTNRTHGMQYNPTQAGAQCPIKDANGNITSSDNGARIITCKSDSFYNGRNLCDLQGYANMVTGAPTLHKPDSIQFTMRYRNFIYLSADAVLDAITGGTYFPYQDFDDMTGTVTYTFYPDYVQMDVVSQRQCLNCKDYGASGQQMPIGFFQQINSFSNLVQSIQRSPADTFEVGQEQGYAQTNVANWNGQRWMLAQALDFQPVLLVTQPSDFLTMAFYSQVRDSGGRQSCPVRFATAQLQGFTPGWDPQCCATGTCGGDGGGDGLNCYFNYNQSSNYQNAPQNIDVQPGNTYYSTAVISPYGPAEIPPGRAKSVATMMSTSPQTASWGWETSWECQN